MNADGVTEVRQRRATVHAALSDPGRLAIVDLLTLGDASPSELSAALELLSNLLTHHINVLLAAGLVSKSRSEGDARRTYLHLVPGAFDQLLPGGARAAARVVRVYRELGALRAGCIVVAPGQRRSGCIGRYSPRRPRRPCRCCGGRPASPAAVAPPL